MLGRYAVHVVVLVELCGHGYVALLLPAHALGDDAGDDQKERQSQGDGEADEDDEADGKVASYVRVSDPDFCFDRKEDILLLLKKFCGFWTNA